MKKKFKILTDVNIQLLSLLVGNEKSKQLIIILHGGPGSGYKPLREIKSFTELEEKYLCLYFDQRSCGDSDFPNNQKLARTELTFDVLQVINFAKSQFPEKEIWLFGSSFGGNLALQTLKISPNCVEGLLLSCPAIFFSKEMGYSFFKQGQQQYFSRLKELVGNGLSRYFELSPKEFFNQNEVTQFIFSKDNPSISLRYTWQMSEWFFEAHLAGIFQSLEIPTCILQGMDDPICSEYHLSQQIVKEKNPNISYYPLKDCGHGPFAEQPKKFLDIYESFIKERSLC